MLTLRQKFNYILDSTIRFFDESICPHCKSTKFKKRDSKFFVTRLHECSECKLLYRFPIDTISSNKSFYQSEYVEDDLLTTKLPSSVELEKFKANKFREGDKNADRYIELFKELFPEVESGIKIIDYGCSWGYISYQIKEQGFDVQSFEISVPRKDYGIEKLGLDITDDQEKLRVDNHIFFSSHVIEHLPDIFSFIELAQKLLRSGGYFIAVCPNGSNEYRDADPHGFHSCWGKVHPNYLNAEFYKEKFKNFPYFIGSTPFDLKGVNKIKQGNQIIGDLSRGELYIVVRF
jgi:2-polyprenyl-3-methyl-5-hydroxy-6-metoxy-1,4-benzoquinol methylase